MGLPAPAWARAPDFESPRQPQNDKEAERYKDRRANERPDQFLPSASTLAPKNLLDIFAVDIGQLRGQVECFAARKAEARQIARVDMLIPWPVRISAPLKR